MNQSGTFTVRFLFVVTLLMVSLLIPCVSPTAQSQGPVAPADQFAAPTPVMTFMDMNTGQPWGRYVISETVTVPKYEYRDVKERVWVPTWVQEPRPTTATQYEQVVSWQLRPRSIPSWNPFTPPQQILEYVPIVQYQPRNVQAMQMTTYQKYEEREITRMIPMMVNASEQRAKFVDRPLTSPPAAGPMASNLVQESAMVAQASRTSARFPTRSIDYPSSPYGSPTFAYQSPTLAWSAPQTLTPSPANLVASSGTTGTLANYTSTPSAPANPAPPSSIAVGNGAMYTSPLVPVPSAWVPPPPAVPAATYQANPYGANPYGAVAGYPYGVPPAASSSPYPSWLYSTGALYSSNVFQTAPPSSMPPSSMPPSSMPSAASVPPSTVYASNAPNFWGRTAPTTMPPTWGTYPPMVSSSGPAGYR